MKISLRPAAPYLLFASLAVLPTLAGADPAGPSLAVQWLDGRNRDHISAAGLHLRLRGRALFERHDLAFHPEVQLLNWEVRNAPDQRDRVWLVGVVNMLRYSPPFCPRCFVDAGLGAYVIENRSAFRLRPNGSNFTFSEEVGLGAYLDAAHRAELRIGYAHFSNGGLATPNPGYDFFHVRAGLKF